MVRPAVDAGDAEVGNRLKALLAANACQGYGKDEQKYQPRQEAQNAAQNFQDVLYHFASVKIPR